MTDIGKDWSETFFITPFGYSWYLDAEEKLSQGEIIRNFCGKRLQQAGAT